MADSLMNIFFFKYCILCLLCEAQAQNLRVVNLAVLWVNAYTPSHIHGYKGAKFAWEKCSPDPERHAPYGIL